MSDSLDAGRSWNARRSHRKSRNGCSTCKRRKIKCDEHRPSCHNCARYGVRCGFADESDSSTPSQQLGNGAGGEGELSMLDLELMHYYTTSTHATISSDPTIRNLWRGPVVSMALARPYLMRSLLALSALHLAYNRPDKRDRYTCVAIEYHQLAVQQAAPLVSDLSRAEAEHLFVFSVSTMIFAMANSKESPDDFLFFGEASFPDWLFLFGGPKFLTDTMLEDFDKGVLAPFFNHGRRRFICLHQKYSGIDDDDDDDDDYSSSPDRSAAMTTPTTTKPRCPGDESLLPAMRELQQRVAAAVAGDAEALRVYTSAIRKLHRNLRAMAACGFDIDVADCFVWVYRVHDDLMPRLRAREQEAVAIFAHFCVMLKRLDAYWWMQGWADRLMQTSYRILDHEHRLWLQWPAGEIGWIPPTP
ncbi:hypothetical protein RB594_008420 [Gaeumannomyces avenae]